MDVPLRRGALDRRAAVTLVAYVAVATAVLAGLLFWLEGTWLLVTVVVFLLLWTLFAAGYVRTWFRMRTVASPLGLHGVGVVSRSHHGVLVAPWDTVESAWVERRLLRIRFRPGAEVDHSRLPDAVWSIVQQRGIRISLAALDVSLEELRRGFVVQSAGRVQLG